MASLILTHSDPVGLVFAIGVAATCATVGLVAGLSSLIKALQTRRTRRLA